MLGTQLDYIPVVEGNRSERQHRNYKIGLAHNGQPFLNIYHIEVLHPY